MRVPCRFVAAITLVAGALVAFSGPAAPAPTWSIRPSANVAAARNASLASVACAGSTCFAVGQATFGSRGTTIIERPTAPGWVIAPSPKAKAARFSALLGVSCPAVKTCFAVGNADDRTLIERWNGAKWSIMPSPNQAPYRSRLSAVTCVNVKNCFAVGQFQAALVSTLVEHWDGAKWSIMPSPSRKPSPMFSTPGVNDLVGVSCTSATNCFAVGGDSGYQYDSKETLIEQWNGTKWIIVPSPKGNYKYNELASVSCPSANSCYAVGDSFSDAGATPKGHTLITHWNGKKWARVASGDSATARQSSLLGIACKNKTTCTTVGFASDRSGANIGTLVRRLSGSAWSMSPSPNPPAATRAVLNGVACVNATACSAVGFSYGASFVPETLVEQS